VSGKTSIAGICPGRELRQNQVECLKEGWVGFEEVCRWALIAGTCLCGNRI
jgi:hypothetical protein